MTRVQRLKAGHWRGISWDDPIAVRVDDLVHIRVHGMKLVGWALVA